ncbi:MAG TPA: MFS transporter, partial [Candidatus Korarchaeota archaeon]|nr:MFS transporter [Candidatus Korarchaeota archaeon]
MKMSQNRHLEGGSGVIDRRNVAGLFLARFLRSCSMNLQRPVLPTFASSLGADSEKMGMIQSISTMVALPSSLFLGRIADKLGRKIMFTASMALTSLSRVIYALSGSWIHFIPASIIGSISFRTYRPLSTTIGAESTVKESRALVMSLLSLGWMIPGFFLPYLAGILAESVGERIVIWISAGISAIGIITVWTIIKETYRFSEPPELKVSIKELLVPNRDLTDIY